MSNTKSPVFPINFLWKELRLDAATTLHLEQTWVPHLPVWSRHPHLETRRKTKQWTLLLIIGWYRILWPQLRNKDVTEEWNYEAQFLCELKFKPILENKQLLNLACFIYSFSSSLIATFHPLGCDIHHPLSPKRWGIWSLQLEVSRESLTPSASAHPGRVLWSHSTLKYSIKIGAKDWQDPLKVAQYFKEKNLSCWAAECENLHRRAKRKRFLVIKYSGISWLSWGKRIGICCWKIKLTRRVFQI